MVDYDGDSEEEEETADPIPGEVVENVEPKKDIDSAVPVISPVDAGEDDDAESPNKRAKLT